MPERDQHPAVRARWVLLATVFAGSAAALLAFMLVAYRHGNQLSIPDMTFAGEIGAAIGALLTFTWPVRLLRR